MTVPAGRHRRLNELLLDIPGNWQEIFLAMRELAVCRAASVRFRYGQDRQDAISEAVIYAMKQIAHYDPARRAAAAYFGRLLRRAMLHWLAEQKRRQHARDLPDSEENRGVSQLDHPLRNRMPGLPARTQNDFRLQSPEDRRRVRDLIDDVLENALRVVEDNPGAPVAEQAGVAVGVLQQIRKRLLGRYNRICADHRNSPAGNENEQTRQ